MKFSFVENIQPYENSWEYDLYEYDDEIQLGDSESHICTVRIIMIKPHEVYIRKGLTDKMFYVAVGDFEKCKYSKDELRKPIMDFVKDEIIQFENKDQIVVLFS